MCIICIYCGSKSLVAILTTVQLPYRPATTTLSMSSYRTVLTVLGVVFSAALGCQGEQICAPEKFEADFVSKTEIKLFGKYFT